jgi:hypothetical protein
MSKSRELANASYEQLKPLIQEVSRFALARWGERASDEDLRLAAAGLIAARDARNRQGHLQIFRKRRFPLDIPALLNLAEEGHKSKVGFAALAALSQITHPAVRKLALRLAATRARWRREGIDLLARNFRPGDHLIVLKWFDADEDEETLHAFGSDLLDFWEQHPDEKSEVPMLLALYERGPCSFCRETAVRRLIKRAALPEGLREECAHDANQDIRELVK